MRRGFGYVLVGLGAFLLVLAPLVKWYVTPRAQVANVRSGCDTKALCDDGVSISPSTGTAAVLFDPGALATPGADPFRRNVELTNVQRVKPDVQASSGANNRTVYESFSQVLDPAGTVVDAGTERIAFNRVTSQMIDCCDANENGTPIEDFSGLNPFKFPFGAEKKTYKYFDGTLAQATPMEYKGTDTVQGLSVYKYEQVIEPTKYAELDVPGALVGQPEVSTVTAGRYYANTRTVWVEPTTGIVVKGTEDQKQTLRTDDVSDKVTLLEAKLGFTEENTTNAVQKAKDGASQLNLISTTIPLVGLIGGLVALGLGLWMVLGARKEESA